MIPEIVGITVGSGAAIQAGVKGVQWYLKDKKLKTLRDHAALFQIFVEKDAKSSPAIVADFWEKVASIYNPKNPINHVSLEIHADHTGIAFYMWAAKEQEEFLQRTLNGMHPAGEVQRVINDYTDPTRYFAKPVKCATLLLEQDICFNTMQATGNSLQSDPVTGICSALSNLPEGDEITIQMIARPVHYRYKNIVENGYHYYKEYGTRQSVPNKVLRRIQDVLPAYTGVYKGVKFAMSQAVTNIQAEGVKKFTHDVPTMKEKAEAACFFDVSIRVLSMARDMGKAHNNLITATAAFSVLTDRNRFKVEREHKIDKFLRDLNARRVWFEPSGNILAPQEMASFMHFPDGSVPYVKRLRSKKMPVPEGVLTYNTWEEARADGAIVFGWTSFRGIVKFVAFKDLDTLMRHMYIIGGTGSGKTTLLQLIALQIIDMGGLTFYDIKGDAVKKFMRYLPEEYEKRVLYIDFSSDDWFIPFNILKQPNMDIFDLATLIVNTFVTVFGTGAIQYHSQRVLRKAVLAVLATDPDGSILEVARMFTDEKYLDQTISRLFAMKGTGDDEFPAVLAYWIDYKNSKPNKRKQEAEAILNKLEYITENKRPRNTLCQKQNALNWREIIDNKRIVLINLDIGKLDLLIQKFFGTLITTFIKKAFYTRSDIPNEADRVPHVVIIDEFEMFTEQDEEFQNMLSLVRSYGGGLILTHQDTEQLDSKMLGLISGNTFTQIALTVGDRSGKSVAPMFPGFDGDDLSSLDTHHAVGRLKRLNPQPFTFETIPVERYYKDNGMKYVDALINEQYVHYYEHIINIKADIAARYRTVEENRRRTDAGAAPEQTIAQLPAGQQQTTTQEKKPRSGRM